jgi:hypothetical protein
VTIVSRVEALERILDAVRDEERLNEKIGKANDQAELLRQAGEALASVGIAVHELSQAERLLPAAASQRARSISDELTQARTYLRENTLAPVETDFSLLVENCRDFKQEITAWVQLTWSEVRASLDMPAVDEELLNQLDRAGLDVEDLRGPVESAQGDLLLLESRHLPVKGDIARLMAAAAKRRGVVDRLQQLLSPAVARFIVAASKPPGAPLALLTEEVRAFLNHHDIESRYHIRLV